MQLKSKSQTKASPMVISRFSQIKHVAALLLAVAIAPLASAELILADDFDVTGGNSSATGFGANGVNHQIASRLSGTAFDANSSLSLLRTNTGKAATAYSIVGNQLVVADAAGAGAFQYSTGGVALNFGSYLAGKTYEIKLTLTLGETENASRRMSFYINDANTSDVGATNLAFQLASNATSGGTQSVYKRLDGAANSTGLDINSSVASGLAFNTPVEFRLVVTDSTNYTAGVYASAYQLYVNDELADSGNFRFANNNRYLIFDVAPNSGPARFENFSVTTVPESSAVAAGVAGLLGGLVVYRRRRRGRAIVVAA